MKDLVFLSGQPYDSYFVWQVEIQIVNFRKFNISDQMQILVWYPNKDTSLNEWVALGEKYPEVKIFYYQDGGVDLKLYIPQLRPHIIAKHFKAHPELSTRPIFYHDADIIFNYLPDFDKLLLDDVNYTSDTSSYLDYNYLRRKEEEGKMPEEASIQRLCKVGGIPVSTFKSLAGNTGGAQYLLKNVDAEFWLDVERQCLEIRREFMYGIAGSINTKYFSSENAGIQSWCADMWAVNMALLNRHRTVNTTPLLDFSWATDSAETYHKKPIFHNAGVSAHSDGLFYKAHWINKNPLGKHHALKPDTASFFYGEAIHAVK